MCYGQEPAIRDEHIHHTKEWAMIAAMNGGIVDGRHRVQLTRRHELEEAAVWKKETFIAGLATQPYGIGLGKFTAKFRPDEPYSATIAIEKGTHDEHGTAIYFEQGARRCLPTRRVYGISDEDALWYVMKDWAQFQPRLSKPRQDPALLYYPPEYSHVFEKYWDVLNDPTQHPDQDMSSHSRDSMSAMAEALSVMELDNWIPQPDTEALEKSQRIARTAALSRRCPIQDSNDYWKSPEEQAQEEIVTGELGFIPAHSEMHRSSAVSDGSTSLSAPMGTESTPGLGPTDTCVAQGNPSYT
jgi:hypothetical protein